MSLGFCAFMAQLDPSHGVLDPLRKRDGDASHKSNYDWTLGVWKSQRMGCHKEGRGEYYKWIARVQAS